MHRTRWSSEIGTTFHNALALCFTETETNEWKIKQCIDCRADEVRYLEEISPRKPPTRKE